MNDEEFFREMEGSISHLLIFINFHFTEKKSSLLRKKMFVAYQVYKVHR